MRNQAVSIDHLFQELKITAKKIIELDFEEGESMELLEQLQSQQQTLRKSIDSIRQQTNSSVLSLSAKQIVLDCVELEHKIQQTMAAYKSKIHERLGKIKDGNRAREIYRTAYAQTDGYFVDDKLK